MPITTRGSPDQVSDPAMTDAADWFPENRLQTLALFQGAAFPLKNVAGTNTISADADVAPLDSYQKGQGWTLVPANTNTGAGTLNIDGKGARAVKRSDGTALSAGDLVAGVMYLLRDSGTNLLVVSQLGAAGPAPVHTYMVLAYEQALNTAGGTATSGARQTYPLNHAEENTIPSASFNSGTNTFTLPAGKYRIDAHAIFAPGTDAAAIYLYNTTDGVDITEVTRQQASGGGAASLGGTFTLAASKAMQVRYAVKTTVATSGLGAAVNDPASATEQYGRVTIEKVA